MRALVQKLSAVGDVTYETKEEAYANFLEQGALATHWLELHNNSYLAGIDATNDPFTMAQDTPRWGYHAAQLAHFLASGNDKMVQAMQSGTFGTALTVRAARTRRGRYTLPP